MPFCVQGQQWSLRESNPYFKNANLAYSRCTKAPLLLYIFVKTIAISDIHLGTRIALTDTLSNFLLQINTDQLIIVGDLFDAVLSLYGKNTRHVLYLLRRLSDRGVKLHYVSGNHDPDAQEMAYLLGAAWHQEQYTFLSDGKNFCAIHGHQFDPYIFGPTTAFMSVFYRVIGLVSPSFSYFISNLYPNKRSAEVQKGAIAYAATNNFHYILCGHTHMALQTQNYTNLGCWCHNTCNYAEINDDVVLLKSWPH